MAFPNLVQRAVQAHRSAENESGIALVVTVIFALVFCLFVAFGVDLGNWYLQAQRVQRAADNAALAAAVTLPSPNASATAFQAAQRNGYAQGPNVEVSAMSAGSRAVVSITDREVETYFIRFVIPKLSIKKSATAEKSSSLPLGSPYNILGGGSLSLPKAGGGTFQSNTWLAINGPCTAREDGDYFGSRYIGNKSATKTSCPGGVDNPVYDRTGYSYYIDVPAAQSSAIGVKLYDPAYWPDAGGPDQETTMSGDLQGCIATMYQLWGMNGSTEQLLEQKTYRCFSQSARPAQWVDFATIPANTSGIDREYRVQVSTWDFLNTGNSTDNGWGANAFAIMAQPNNKQEVCDARTDNACPKVFGKTAISLLNNFAGVTGANTARFSLAGVAPEYSGTTIDLSIFDPGEGVKSIEVVMPNGTLATFNWKAYPEDVPYSGTSVTSIETGGLGPQPYANEGMSPGSNYKFNDRRIVISIPVPADTAQWLGPNGDNWWQIQYTIAPGSAPTPDRTTWGADLGGDGPAHLVRNGS